jgi:predicted tellurium resistance membrane protein TerC
MTKTVTEIHEKLEGEETHANPKPLSFSSAVTQIVLLDIVFSFDSILTAIGIADEVMIMVAAVVISLGIMLVFAGKVADFVNKHPSIKMLALSFLLMIGMLLTMEGLPDSLHLEVPKGYVYFAMAFSFLVEMLNLRMKKKSKNTVQLRNNTIDDVRDDYYEEEPKNPNL